MGPSNARRPGLGTAVTKGTGADGSERPGFRHLPGVLEDLHVAHGRRGEGREPRGHGPTPLVEGVRPPGVDVQRRTHSLLADRKRYGQRAESAPLGSLLYVIPPAGSVFASAISVSSPLLAACIKGPSPRP